MGALMASGLTTLKIGKKGSGLLLTRYWLNILKEGKGDFKHFFGIILLNVRFLCMRPHYRPGISRFYM